MSNPIAKAERSKAKDARQMPASDDVKHHKKRKKRKREWAVIGPARFGGSKECVYHKAVDEEGAKAWLEKWLRSFSVLHDASKFRIEKIER